MTRKISVTFTINGNKEDNLELIDKLEEVNKKDGGKSRYIRDLIREDIKKNKSKIKNNNVLKPTKEFKDNQIW